MEKIIQMSSLIFDEWFDWSASSVEARSAVVVVMVVVLVIVSGGMVALFPSSDELIALIFINVLQEPDWNELEKIDEKILINKKLKA